MNFKKTVGYLAIFLTLLLPIALADESWYTPLGSGDTSQFGAVENTITGLSNVTGIPINLLHFPQFLYYVVGPFAAIWAIIFGFLHEFKIFKRSEKPNMIISFSIALVVLGSKGMWYMVNTVFVLMGTFGFAAFFVVFGLGLYFWFKGKSGFKGFGKRVKADEAALIEEDERILQDDKNIKSLENQEQKETDPAKKAEIDRAIQVEKEKRAKDEADKKDIEEREKKDKAAELKAQQDAAQKAQEEKAKKEELERKHPMQDGY